MGWTDDLLVGIALYLDNAGVGTFKATGKYTSEQNPIFLEDMPSTPDAAISLTTYAVSSDLTLNDVEQGLQVRVRGGRGDYASDSDLADQVFAQLHGAEGLDLGNDIRVALIQHISGAALGQDTNGRPERTDNYYLSTNRPSTHRPD